MMKNIFSGILAFLLMTACQHSSTAFRFQEHLIRAEILIENHPHLAWEMLDSLSDIVEEQPQHLRMEYALCMAKAQNGMSCDFMPIDSFTPVVAYYEQHGDANEKLLTYYLLGRMYYEQHEAPMAFSYYQKALLVEDSIDVRHYMNRVRLHSQLARLYQDQWMLEKAVLECEKAGEIALEYRDTLTWLNFQRIKMKPLSRMGQYQNVESISDLCRKAFLERGDTSQAAVAHQMALRAYIENGSLEKAREAIDDYERHSGLFDSTGNILKGREIYYFKKGLYWLKCEEFQKAEEMFRKLLATQNTLNAKEGAYRGLTMVYLELSQPDSMSKYAQLYGEVHDSVYKNHTTQIIANMDALYNYNRNRIIAENRAKETKKMQGWMEVLVLLLVLCALSFLIWNKKIKQQHKKHMQDCLDNYASEKDDMEKHSKERQKKYEQKIGALEDLVSELENKEAENQQMVLYMQNVFLDKLHKFCSSVKSSEKERITASEWSEFIRFMWTKQPIFLQQCIRNKLDKTDIFIVSLIMMDFRDEDIRMLLDLSPSNFSNRKRRINSRLFCQATATSLRQNIDTIK